MSDESTTSAPIKRGRGNPNWSRGQKSANPGGVVDPSRKNVRKALLKLVETKADSKLPKPKTRAEEVALELWQLAMSKDVPAQPAIPAAEGKPEVPAKPESKRNEHIRLRALVELIDRIDGRTAPSKEETDAIAASGNKVLIIDRAGRPPRKPEEQ